MSEKERSVQTPSSKYQNIVKKAKETRTSKEKNFNSSHDASFDAFRRRKKKANLSQSFVMRHTMALSTKNKQLVSSLTQSKQFAAELEKNLRIMQEKFMTLLMKLNSTEVAFGHCKLELYETKELVQDKENLYRNLRTELQVLLDNTPDPGESSIAKNSSPTINHSNPPQRVPLSRNRFSSASPKVKNNKWKPDLDKVEEIGQEEQALDQPTDEEKETPDLSISSPFSLLSSDCDQTDFASPSPSLKNWLNSHSRHSSNNSQVLSRKKRRTTVSSYFDPDESESDAEQKEDTLSPTNFKLDLDSDKNSEESFDDDEQVTSDDETTNDVDLTLRNNSLLNESSIHLNKEKTDSDPDYTPLICEEKRYPKKKLKVVREKKASKPTDHQSMDHTDHSIVSMDLTAPNEADIIVTKKKTKKRQPCQNKSKAASKKSKMKKDDALVKSDTDVFNCSNDSFIVNPTKKIQLSSKEPEGKTKEKTRSLPMLNITNMVAEESEAVGRRRRTCISYAEPNLRKKMRRGDKFFNTT